MTGYSWLQRALFIPPVLLGIALLIVAPRMKAEPPKASTAAPKKVVRVLKVEPRNIQPSAFGYGHTEPAQDWQAQSELDGAVVWVSEQYKTGTIIRKDSEILRIDPASYQLIIARLQAELEVLTLTKQTIIDSLKIAEKEFQVQQSEYARSIKLSETGHISKTEKDRATKELLSSQQQLQTQKNQLAINQAQQKVLQTELALANRDLEQTVIKAPFDIRIVETLVGLAEYVNKGELLLKADGIDAVEVRAQFPLGKMRPLRNSNHLDSLDEDVHSNLSATVELQAGDKVITWPAAVSRSGGEIDAQTQSQSLVAQINQPYQQAIPGEKPPLIRGTFVKVTLKAPVMEQQVLLPINAIHDGKVYTVSEGKLRIKPVSVDFIQGQVAVIKSGVEFGDVVALSKLSPAVEGMSLQPQPDEKIGLWLDTHSGFKAVNAIQKEGKL
ncbi:efflux RND transporter periplasmic adaptor subunit [Vibrio sp. B1FLJ16]|uniref:efflux RND transporter periplasmic adaptor subunit n=1 Tax=Vibrio sp. B1FLJ16 TaxID=2751178 RepID=UPI0015F4877A|nr:HlyD family efflux transporter periplasmic adaptor subunit [Vibrio sp. B1FLJ16]CAD7822688.1 Belongs to the membrane fusion protein (MFP) (TC 8.A.1) family [Vibrio sp. B1FLJ16]CAD7824260.1 Belongs to the membrane fusion protein (MFP) (TC 8.A.1) family [Vibrio sp. B1FLJ16]CAE6949770.1 Belongs to the membrane fusion protein (MFP) (TC 8.A.1) family [Vibrio sp. B1FLJ16]CAE6954046.1 Belongs to the membrane fusion protein (MFP) (TC 8.A.1) family [Vibrio sp. B1FLJ16]